MDFPDGGPMQFGARTLTAAPRHADAGAVSARHRVRCSSAHAMRRRFGAAFWAEPCWHVLQTGL